MIVHTTRTQILGVAAAWREQYGHYKDQSWEWARVIGRQLDALDGETASAKDVEAIIGNDTWTKLQCEECESAADIVLEFKCASRSIMVCRGCLQKGIGLLDNETKRRRTKR